MYFKLIKHNIKKKLYKDKNSFLNDIKLIFENAKLYNSPETLLYKKAIELETYV